MSAPTSALPGWLAPVVEAAASITVQELTRFQPPFETSGKFQSSRVSVHGGGLHAKDETLRLESQLIIANRRSNDLNFARNDGQSR